VLDLKAYLFSIPPVVQENKPVEIMPPFRWRFNLAVWNWLFFRPGSFQPDPNQSAEWNRGAYLATAMGHCVECHTPRNLAGGLNRSMAYAGTEDGPEGELSANITPDEETGIGSWSIEDIVWLLQTGFNPDGDDVQGVMSEVIENGYKYLTEADLRAIAVYIRSLQPVSNKLERKGE
jgi:mono/diheme cytochrome c family protein